MIGRFKYKKLAKYPHMKPFDVAIWEKFIDENLDFFDSVDYDICIGKGADFLPDDYSTPDGRENRLYQKKIDVVGYIGEKVWIIEIKPNAGMHALGQILTYKFLTKDILALNRQQTLAIICEKTATEMHDLFKEHKIKIITV
jgi:hypothetical protein